MLKSQKQISKAKIFEQGRKLMQRNVNVFVGANVAPRLVTNKKVTGFSWMFVMLCFGCFPVGIAGGAFCYHRCICLLACMDLYKIYNGFIQSKEL